MAFNINFIDFIFFFYTFIGFYMLTFFVIIYYSNKKNLYEYPKGRILPISIIVPCFNDAEHIAETIKALLNLDYPKNKTELIIVDDKSTDKSVNVIRKFTKRFNNIKLIVNKRNSGGAAEPTNLGIKAAKYDFVAVVDADSVPDKDVLLKMIGYLQEDERVAAVTCSILAKKPYTFIQKLQELEYKIIAFGRKLLDKVDSVYVTPGPFALYRKKALMEVGLFDTKNLTQDIEIVWRLLSRGYKTRMSLGARVYSATPAKFNGWWRQRIRWNIGGTQTLLKYKELILKRGMLGNFIIPFFSISLFLGLFGLGLFTYLFLKRTLIAYLSTKYSLYASTAIVSLQDLTFAPSVLNFFGLVLFFLGLIFTLLGLSVVNERTEKRKFFNILFYLTIYLAIYPINLVVSLYKMWRKEYKW